MRFVCRTEWPPVVPFGGTGYDAYLRLFAGAPHMALQAGDGPLVFIPAFDDIHEFCPSGPSALWRPLLWQGGGGGTAENVIRLNAGWCAP